MVVFFNHLGIELFNILGSVRFKTPLGAKIFQGDRRDAQHGIGLHAVFSARRRAQIGPPEALT